MPIVYLTSIHHVFFEDALTGDLVEAGILSECFQLLAAVIAYHCALYFLFCVIIKADSLLPVVIAILAVLSVLPCPVIYSFGELQVVDVRTFPTSLTFQ